MMKKFLSTLVSCALLLLVPLALPALAAGTFTAASAYYSSNSAVASTTVTASQLGLDGFSILDMTGTLTAAGTLTTPSAAVIIANNQNVPDGDSYILRIINRTAATYAWTLTPGTGVSVTGTATIAAASWVDFVVTYNVTAGTVNFRRVGTGSN